MFALYVNHLPDTMVDVFCEGIPNETFTNPTGRSADEPLLDVHATASGNDGTLALAIINKSENTPVYVDVCIVTRAVSRYNIRCISGNSPDSYNDVGHDEVHIADTGWQPAPSTLLLTLAPHSVNLVTLA